jgi:hypothetical protein
MFRKFIISAALITAAFGLNAQQTAMQFSGVDCNNNAVDLYSDLNAGKAVVLFYYMANCGSCPPPAQKIQTMANNVMATYPGMVKAYAFPYTNSTTCTYSASWVVNNNLPLYAPMDSGATQVAYYGGFGMPTVVLVGGTDHRVMWVTQNFSTSDTTIMRDSILNLLSPQGINSLASPVSKIDVFPNPANDVVNVDVTTSSNTAITVEVVSLNGQLVQSVYNGTQNAGTVRRPISTVNLADGSYFIRVTSEGQTSTAPLQVAH